MSEVQVSGTAAVINDVSMEIGEWSKGHGFQEDWDLAAQLEQIASAIINAQNESDLPGETEAATLYQAAEALRTNVLGTKLMLIVSEAAEAMETLRDTGASGVLNREGNFGEELADGMVRLADLASIVKSPIGDELVRKMEKNAQRPFKHGRVC